MIAQADDLDAMIAEARKASGQAGTLPGSVGRGREAAGADDIDSLIAQARAAPTPDYRGDPTKANVDLGPFLKGLGEGVVHGAWSVIAGVPATASALGDVIMQPFGGRTQPDPLQPVTEAIRPTPLEPAGPGQEVGRTLGGVVPWAVAGALAPESLIPLAGTTTLGDKYHQLTQQGIPPDKALMIAGAHGAADATLFALMPAYGKVIEQRLGQPVIAEATKALATGGAFAATQVVKNAIDKGTTDPEVEVLTGAKGAVGQGILLHTVMAMLTHAVANVPRGTPEETNAEQVQPPEASRGEAVPEVLPSVAAEAKPGGEAGAGLPAADQVGAEAQLADTGVGAEPGERNVPDEVQARQPKPGPAVGGEVGDQSVESKPARPLVAAPEPVARENPTSPNGEEPTPPSGEEQTTSIKDAKVAEELASMGFEPPKTEKHTFAEEWTKAKATFDKDPFAGQKLVDRLITEPDHAPTRQENAILALEANRLIVERDAAEQAVTDAPGDPQALARRAAAEDAYARAAQVFEKAGHESSGSLSFRRMMIARDYSLAAMERRESVTANGGEPLSDAQRAEVKDLHDRITKTQAAFDEYVKQAEQKRTDLESQLATEKLRTEVKARRPAKEKPVREYIKTKADEAREFYRKGGTMLRGGALPIGPEDVARIAFIAADHIAAGLDAGAELVRDFGERIKPHLEAILSKAREIAEVSPAVAKIAEKMKENPKDMLAIRPQVLKIAKHVLSENPALEREGLTGRVHEIVKPVLPSLTHEQTRDLISGYGDFKQLSKDELSKRLRDLKGQMQQVAKLEAMIERGEAPLKTGMERRTPSDEERKLVKEVNETKRRLGISVTDPETQLRSALQARKTYWTNQIKDIEERIAAGDFEKRPPKPSLLLDPEAQRLQAAHEAAKKEFKDRARQADLAKRTPFEKAADLAVSLTRAFKLTSPGTIGKLASGGASRLVTTPIEEVLGGIIGKIPGYRGIFEQAPREGGLNVDALAKGYASAWRDTITQGAKKLKTGKWDYETLYGKGGPEAAEWTGFFGRLHGMMKTPEALNEFTLAAEKRERWVAKNMRDPTNPIVQMGIGIDAAKDADRAVFNQDSRVADEVNSVLRKLETPSKTTGRPTVLGKTAATIVREEIPFAKVPSNIVGEALVNAFGLVSGNIKARELLRAGVENIDPAEADQVARHLKKGALGAAVLLLGYFNHKNVGGFYQPGKRQSDQPEFGTARVGGVTVPKVAMAFPLMLIYQLGGTIGNVAETYLRKRDIEPVGLPMATLAGTLGLLQDVPLVGESTELSKFITEPQSREGFMGRRVAGDVIPSGVAWAARKADTDAQGNEVKRKAVTIGENIQAAIPGLRQKLPVKQ